MKAFKAICTATVLVLVLGVPTYGGEILTPGLTSPAPVSPSLTAPEAGSTSPSDVPSTSTEAVESSVLTELLMAILSVF